MAQTVSDLGGGSTNAHHMLHPAQLCHGSHLGDLMCFASKMQMSHHVLISMIDLMPISRHFAFRVREGW